MWRGLAIALLAFAGCDAIGGSWSTSDFRDEAEDYIRSFEFEQRLDGRRVHDVLCGTPTSTDEHERFECRVDISTPGYTFMLYATANVRITGDKSFEVTGLSLDD